MSTFDKWINNYFLEFFQKNKLTECKYITNCIKGVNTKRVKMKFHMRNIRSKLHWNKNVLSAVDRHLICKLLLLVQSLLTPGRWSILWEEQIIISAFIWVLQWCPRARLKVDRSTSELSTGMISLKAARVPFDISAWVLVQGDEAADARFVFQEFFHYYSAKQCTAQSGWDYTLNDSKTTKKLVSNSLKSSFETI